MSEPHLDLERLNDSQLRRIIYSTWDFQQALSALTFLMEDCDYDRMHGVLELRRFRCYETAVIVSFARPFEASRGETTLGLKTIGLRLDPDELALKGKILSLRRKIFAHSDEDFMHFRSAVLTPFDDHPVAMPHLQFNESLYLQREDLRPLEGLLRKLVAKTSKAIFMLAQQAPDRLNVYRAPS
jgi:hypothetical protein